MPDDTSDLPSVSTTSEGHGADEGAGDRSRAVGSRKTESAAAGAQTSRRARKEAARETHSLGLLNDMFRTSAMAGLDAAPVSFAGQSVAAAFSETRRRVAQSVGDAMAGRNPFASIAAEIVANQNALASTIAQQAAASKLNLVNGVIAKMTPWSSSALDSGHIAASLGNTMNSQSRALLGAGSAMARLFAEQRALTNGIAKQVAAMKLSALNLGLPSSSPSLASALASFNAGAGTMPRPMSADMVAALGSALQAVPEGPFASSLLKPSALAEVGDTLRRTAPDWSIGLAAVSTAVAEREFALDEPDEVRSEVQRVLVSRLDTTLRTQDAAESEAEVPQPSGTSDSSIPTLVIRLWTDVVTRIPALTQESRINLFCVILTVVLTLYTAHESDVTSQAILRAVQEQVTETRALRGDVVQLRDGFTTRTTELREGDRLTVLRAVPLRSAPEASASRIGTVPAGGEVIVKARMGRWIAVIVPSDSKAQQEGWIYGRYLRPATLDTAR